jgi:hypothetical protein
VGQVDNLRPIIKSAFREVLCLLALSKRTGDKTVGATQNESQAVPSAKGY